MKRIVIVYGVIAGVILAAMFFVTAPFYENGTLNLDNGMLVGYATMVVSLSLVFFGIKSYRDNHLNGSITFGRAFKVGMLITLIASCLYGIGWEISYHTVNKNFVDIMWRCQEEKMIANGTSAGDIQVAYQDHQRFVEMYKNPLIRFSMTVVVEILPVGLLITLISAALLKRKTFLPSTEPA